METQTLEKEIESGNKIEIFIEDQSRIQYKSIQKLRNVRRGKILDIKAISNKDSTEKALVIEDLFEDPNSYFHFIKYIQSSQDVILLSEIEFRGLGSIETYEEGPYNKRSIQKGDEDFLKYHKMLKEGGLIR